MKLIIYLNTLLHEDNRNPFDFKEKTEEPILMTRCYVLGSIPNRAREQMIGIPHLLFSQIGLITPIIRMSFLMVMVLNID